MTCIRQLPSFLFLLLAFGALAGCNNKGGTLKISVENTEPGVVGDQGNSLKPILSEWTEASNLFKLNLKTAMFATNSPASVLAITGQTCQCTVLITGSETAGQIVVSACSGDAQCAGFNSAGNYSRSGSSLLICTTATSCLTLK